MSAPPTGQPAPGSPTENYAPETAPGFDPSVPSPARMYDYYLGGKDNFPVDREAAELALSVVPFGREVARANRQFLARAVTFMAREGISQFIDLGTGLPTRPNVHEVARSIHPGARVLYVDNDPMVCAHARALLATNDGVAAIHRDIRAPQAILNDPVTRTVIDFTRPVGVLFVAVLHFLTDDDRPWEQVAAFRWRMASGSMLAVSHITSDGTPPEVQATIRDVYAEASAPAVFRTRPEIESFFGGLDLVEPGLVEVGAWRSLRPSPLAPLRFLGGVARIIPELRATMSPAPTPALDRFQRACMAVTPYSWPLSSSLELRALPGAVPCARLHAKHLAWEWGLTGVADTIELLVSELTTNSVQAVTGHDGQPSIRLRLLSDNTRVRIEVWDADPRPPAPKDPAADGMPDLEAESGRGLFLVAALSARWAWCATREPAGKVTWCELDIPRLESSSEIAGSAAQPRLPRRIPGALKVRPVAVMNDPDILRRLCDGLRNLDRS